MMEFVKLDWLIKVTLLCILITITNAKPSGVSVSVMFGSTATLPCFGYGGKEIYIYWKTESQFICSFEKSKFEPGPGFEQRADIPKDRISEGNFSLTIRQTKFSDAGLYRCFCSQHYNERRLCSTVMLSISGHEDHQMLRQGEDLRISLYTQEPVNVTFEDSTSVCAVEGNRVSPGPRFEGKLLLNNGCLILCTVTSIHQGRYEVKDHHGNVINSVTLTVKTEDSLTDYMKLKFVTIICFMLIFGICVIALALVIHLLRKIMRSVLQIMPSRCTEKTNKH